MDRTAVALLVLTLWTAPGCATTIAATKSPTSLHGLSRKHPRSYLGTQLNYASVELGTRCLIDKDQCFYPRRIHALFVPASLIDAVPSLLADTLLLPYTIYLDRRLGPPPNSALQLTRLGQAMPRQLVPRGITVVSARPNPAAPRS